MAVDELVSLATTYPQIRDFHSGPAAGRVR